MEQQQHYLVLKSLTKKFGGGPEAIAAVDAIDLEVREGELVTLLGPSGCGKTTTLRMIAGFETPSDGEILLDGERINEVPPNRRPTTMVFQNYALFPHMTVAENISYGLRIRGEEKGTIKRKTEEIIRLVGLSTMGDRAPAQLSGGQQQRVSLARSLVMEPKVLLLDEPLSNLDAKLRVSTRLEIRRLQQRIGITSVYVTHDQEEAMTLSDRVVIMKDGRIQQVGTPREVYAHPANTFVAGFIGRANFLDAVYAGPVADGEGEILVMGKKVRVPCAAGRFTEGQKVVLVVRPESVSLEPVKKGSVTGTIYESVYLGNQVSYGIDIEGNKLNVDIVNPQVHRLFENGEAVSLSFQEKSLHILPASEESGVTV